MCSAARKYKGRRPRDAVSSSPRLHQSVKDVFLVAAKQETRVGRRKGVQIARTKKKNYEGAKSASDKRMGKKGERERETMQLHFLLLFLWSPFAGFLYFPREMHSTLLRTVQASKGPDKTVGIVFYSLVRLSAGSSPNCRVKRKEKVFCVPLHVQPLDAPPFTVTGKGSFLFLRPRASAATKKNCKESDSARFFSSLFFLFCKTAKISAVATESSVCSTRVRKRGKIFPFSRTCTSFFRREAECAHFSRRPAAALQKGKPVHLRTHTHGVRQRVLHLLLEGQTCAQVVVGRQAKLSNRSPPFLLDRIVLCCVTTNDAAVQKCAKLSRGGGTVAHF